MRTNKSLPTLKPRGVTRHHSGQAGCSRGGSASLILVEMNPLRMLGLVLIEALQVAFSLKNTVPLKNPRENPNSTSLKGPCVSVVFLMISF